MKILDAFLQGMLKTIKSMPYILLVYLISFIVSMILATSLSTTIQSSLGNSLAGENMLDSYDDLWYSSFSEQANGLAGTFHPSVVGIGAVFNGLDSFLRGNLLKDYSAIVGVGLIYMLLWTFFSAGFISIYAAQEERPSFFQQAVRFFPRFLILGVLAGILYYLVFNFVLTWLNNTITELTRETIDERIHFTYTVFKYFIILALVWSVNILFDYSKIFTVIKDHKNALTAPLKASFMVFRNFSKTFGLYFMIGFVWVVLMLLYWLIAPGADQASMVPIFGAFLLGQLYIVTRICTRCLFFSGQTAMCAVLTAEVVEEVAVQPEMEEKRETKVEKIKEDKEEKQAKAKKEVKQTKAVKKAVKVKEDKAEKPAIVKKEVKPRKSVKKTEKKVKKTKEVREKKEETDKKDEG